MSDKCDFCEDNVKFHFDMPMVLNSSLIVKLKRLETTKNCCASVSQLEKKIKVHKNFLQNNWNLYGMQAICIVKEKEYFYTKRHANFFEKSCNHKYTKKYSSIKHLIDILKKCKLARDTHKMTYSAVYTRILNKMEYSFNILINHIKLKHIDHAVKLCERYFSNYNIIFHLMYVYFDDKDFQKFINDNITLSRLNLFSRACIEIQAGKDEKEYNQLTCEWNALNQISGSKENLIFKACLRYGKFSDFKSICGIANTLVKYIRDNYTTMLFYDNDYAMEYLKHHNANHCDVNKRYFNKACRCMRVDTKSTIVRYKGLRDIPLIYMTPMKSLINADDHIGLVISRILIKNRQLILNHGSITVSKICALEMLANDLNLPLNNGAYIKMLRYARLIEFYELNM